MLIFTQRGVEALRQFDVRNRRATFRQAGKVECIFVEFHLAAGLGQRYRHSSGVTWNADFTVVFFQSAEFRQRAVTVQPFIVDARTQAVFEHHDVLATGSILEQFFDRHQAAVDQRFNFQFQIIVVGDNFGGGDDVGWRTSTVQALLATDFPALQIGNHLGQKTIRRVTVCNETKGAASLNQRAAFDEFIAALQFKIAITFAFEDVAVFIFGDDQTNALQRIDFWQIIVITEFDVSAQTRIDFVHFQNRLRTTAHLFGTVSLRRNLTSMREHAAPRIAH